MALDFQGPYHFSQIANGPDLCRDRNKQGLYIWGFLYDKDLQKENGLGDVIKCNKVIDPNGNIFIPHYVGLDNTLFTRLIQHHNVLAGDGRKYKRLSLNYMRKFFVDNHFPINNPPIQQVINFIHHYPRCVEYWNNDQALKAIYPGIVPMGYPRHWPITQQIFNGTCLPDTLSELINNFNNFWLCYAIPEEPEVSLPLNYLEAYTFWSLKGKTISGVDFNHGQLHIPIVFIGRNRHLFKSAPGNVWPGY